MRFETGKRGQDCLWELEGIGKGRVVQGISSERRDALSSFSVCTHAYYVYKFPQ